MTVIRCWAYRAVLLLAGCLAAAACGQPSESPPESGTDEAGVDASLATPAYRLYARRASQSYQAGDFEDALEAAQAALGVAPRAREPYEMISRIYLQSGRDQEAAVFFERVAGQQRDLAAPWYLLGTHQGRLFRWAESIAAFERALELDPEDENAYFRLATAFHTTGEFDRAAAAFGEANRLAPDRPDIAAGLVRSLRIVGDYETAERVVADALSRSPDSAELHYAVAQFRTREGREAEAEEHLRRATSLDRRHGKAHSDLAKLLQRQGREEDSRRPRATAGRIDDYITFKGFLLDRMALLPRHPGVPLLLAELELSEQQVTAAMRWFTRSEALGGPVRRIVAGRAYANFLAGNREGGEEELRKIEGWDDPRAGLARGAQLVLVRRLDAAAQAITRAVEAGPAEKTFLCLASDLYGYTGRDAESLELLELANISKFPPAPTKSLAPGESWP